MWKVGSCLFLLLLPVTSTLAVAAGNVTAYVAHNVEPHSNGIQVDYTLKRNDGAGKEWYKQATVHYPKDKAKKRVMNSRGRVTPLGLGLTAVVAAAGWGIDELTNQVMSGQSQQGDFLDDGTYQEGFYWAVDGPEYGRTAQEACDGYGAGYTSTGTSCLYTENGVDYGPYGTLAKYPCGSIVSWYCSGVPTLNNSPVPDSELWPVIENLLNSLPPDVLREIFENGGVPILTPELMGALAEYAAETASENSQSTDPVNDESTQDEVDKETQDEPLPENSPEITQINVSKVDWDSGLGSGSCPQSHSVAGMFPLSTQWGTICDAATNIFKPIFLLLCAIGSAYIVAGVRPSGTVD